MPFEKWKKVLVKVETFIVVSVPADNTVEDTEFLLNESSHCASNEFEAIGEIVKRDGPGDPCGCFFSKFTVVRDARKSDLDGNAFDCTIPVDLLGGGIPHPYADLED
jgi:hypothetical protein